jgi:hypothetical protein
MVAFHKEIRVSPTITGKSMFRNKIPETLKPGCLCDGMKTPDHDYELHLGSTAKPDIQKTLDCRSDLRINLRLVLKRVEKAGAGGLLWF